MISNLFSFVRAVCRGGRPRFAKAAVPPRHTALSLHWLPVAALCFLSFTSCASYRRMTDTSIQISSDTVVIEYERTETVFVNLPKENVYIVSDDSVVNAETSVARATAKKLAGGKISLAVENKDTFATSRIFS